MRLLIIEDDMAVVTALRRGLQDSYIIDVATKGNEGQQKAELGDYDLIILDLNLPDRSGLEICQELRKEGNVTPILIVTSRTEVDDKVTLLDIGADDYLTKPFSLEELRARIRALLRRESATARSSRIEVGELVLDTASRTVSCGGEVVELRRKEYDLLEYMVRNTGKTLTRQMILDHVWDMNDSLWTNVVDVHIKYLRDKLDRRFNKKMIVTVHGIGYKLDVVNQVVGSRGR